MLKLAEPTIAMMTPLAFDSRNSIAKFFSREWHTVFQGAGIRSGLLGIFFHLLIKYVIEI